jgi:hypothetical protein
VNVHAGFCDVQDDEVVGTEQELVVFVVVVVPWLKVHAAFCDVHADEELVWVPQELLTVISGGRFAPLVVSLLVVVHEPEHDDVEVVTGVTHDPSQLATLATLQLPQPPSTHA